MLRHAFSSSFSAATSCLQHHQWLSTAASSSGATGLFGIARLQTPADFPAWAREAITRCGELVEDVLAAPPDASVVQLVDDISDAMCQVYDSAECCRNVHSDSSWRQAASKACELLGEYLGQINHHRGLYNKLLEMQQLHAASAAAAAGDKPAERQLTQQLLSPAQLAAFCPETLVVAKLYRQDFEKYGIHLPDGSQRDQAAQLLAANQHFPAAFNAALVDHKQLGLAAVPAKLLPASLAAHASLLTGKVTIPLDAGSVNHFLAYTDNEAARQQVYLAAGAAPARNLSLLDDMLAVRHQLAHLLGFPSYAAFKTADSTLAGTPAAAESFLAELADGCRQQADQEVAALTRLKRQHLQDAGAELQPWDQEFYSRQLAASRPDSHAATAAAPYLQLDSVLRGLGQLLQQLMGLTLQQQPTAPGEQWAPGVLKFDVTCREAGRLGLLYLDLLARPGKVPSSGILYPIRCGRQLPGGAYQQPVLCLVGNLSASSSSSGSARAPGELLLTWREFKTLLHEAGHAVHSLVSRTRYQHVWGTRCSQDIVEVPSHLWEHFASDPRSLALLARHRVSRAPMDPRLAQQLAAQASVTPALELQQQALLSLVDLVYHGEQLPAPAGGTTAVWSQLARQHSSLPPPATTCPQARFGHLTIYGASYYSYLFARCLSEAIWDTHLAADPLDPAAGARIKTLLLQPGGSVEPLDLLTASLGGEAGRDRVLEPRLGGWCPKPAPLLNSMRAGERQRVNECD